jgi:regulatory LuxR family protein
MAAEGLSNRAIGQKLYLSHRTVSFHLYRVFPKLGITSRTELRAALSAATPPHPALADPEQCPTAISKKPTAAAGTD